MNNCNFIGRLTTDPEIKEINNGKKLANFTIAVDREYKDGNGNKITDFIPCIAWDPIAGIVGQYFRKGNLIGITGRFESRSYEDSNGNKRIFYSIQVNHIDFIQGKSSGNAQETAPVAPQKKIESTPDNEDDYGLPFPVEGA